MWSLLFLKSASEWLTNKQCFDNLLRNINLFQMLLKALLLRMRRTLDDDVFMPLYPKK